MQINLLGPIEVDDGGVPIAVAGARLRALLGRLALDAGRPVRADLLISALWGDDAPVGAGNALQSLVSRLRRALPPDAVIRSAPGGYRLDVPADTVDAQRFAALRTRGRHQLDAGRPAEAVEVEHGPSCVGS